MVSIRCMTYNHAHYITDAMDGFCMQQTTFPYVAIIVDDASTDGEPEVIRNYLSEHFDLDEDGIARQWETDDAHFIYARHKENQNCYFAVILLKYNFWQAKKAKAPLMKKWADAKYIAMCEGDDYWISSDKLQKQVSFLEKNKEFVMCGHDYKIFFEHTHTFFKETAYQKLEHLPFTYDLDNFFKGDYTQPLTCMYRNHDRSLSIPFGYKYYRDRVFFYYVLKEGKGCILPEIMGVYRKHSGGILSGKSASENYHIYMSIAVQIYNKEGDGRALVLFKRHALGYLSHLWMTEEKKQIPKNVVQMAHMAPLSTTTEVVGSFLFSLLSGKMHQLYHQIKF